MSCPVLFGHIIYSYHLLSHSEWISLYILSIVSVIFPEMPTPFWISVCTRTISVTWQLVWNTKFQAPRQTYWKKIMGCPCHLCLWNLTDDFDADKSLANISLNISRNNFSRSRQLGSVEDVFLYEPMSGMEVSDESYLNSGSTWLKDSDSLKLKNLMNSAGSLQDHSLLIFKPLLVWTESDLWGGNLEEGTKGESSSPSCFALCIYVHCPSNMRTV